MNTEAAAVEPQEQTTALTVQQRAVAAMGSTEALVASLRAAVEKSAGIVKITNDDGYKEADAARKALKRERVELERRGKVAREDAQAFAKAVIAEEKRLVAIIEPEEDRLAGLVKAEDDRKAAEARKALEAEQQRIATINKRIAWIVNRALDLVGKLPHEIAQAVDDLVALPITDELYGEFREQAEAARGIVLDKLRTMRDAAVKAEADAKALEEARAELARKQAALDAADRERADRIAKEDAERKFANDWDDAHRENEQRDHDAKRDAEFAFACDWESAHAENRRRDEAKAEAERRRIARKERAELEAKADPWAALARIGRFARDARSHRPIAVDVLSDALSEIQIEVDAVEQYRVELGKAAA